MASFSLKVDPLARGGDDFWVTFLRRDVMGFLFHLDPSTQVSIIILKRIAASGYPGKREQHQSSGMIVKNFGLSL